MVWSGLGESEGYKCLLSVHLFSPSACLTESIEIKLYVCACSRISEISNADSFLPCGKCQDGGPEGPVVSQPWVYSPVIATGVW
jgi:hypothetical protein